MNLEELEASCLKYLENVMAADPAHDISHVQRVVQNTIKLTKAANGNSEVTIPAAWLHDCVSVAKDSPLRKQASRLAADEAVRFLESISYRADLLDQIHHAIEAHSYSANLKTNTLDAQIVQDADRLEAVGAIGIARCLLTGGTLQRPLYNPADPFADNRTADDGLYTLDHFYCKLLGLADSMKTDAGKAEAVERTVYMRGFLEQLRAEIGG